MSKLLGIQIKADEVAKYYEQLLAGLVHHAKTKTQLGVESIWWGIQGVSEIGLEEAKHIQKALSRDIVDAKQYIVDSNKEWRFWLGFEYGMLKSELWQKFKEATDISPIEILRFDNLGALNTYIAGEVIGLGTLQCDQCNKVYYFTYPSIIPICSQCNGTHFHRAFNVVD